MSKRDNIFTGVKSLKNIEMFLADSLKGIEHLKEKMTLNEFGAFELGYLKALSDINENEDFKNSLHWYIRAQEKGGFLSPKKNEVNMDTDGRPV